MSSKITFPVESDPDDFTRDLTRRHNALLPEQDKREPLVNTIEHGGTTFVADVEKVAARQKRDAAGNPVFRRIYVDDGEGIPFVDMPVLLRNPGKSSKASAVFAGNHGMGLILANGLQNPYGMAVIAKTADHPWPYMALWQVVPNEAGNPVGQLFPFQVEDDDGNIEFVPVVELFPGQGKLWDGLDWYEVWKTAYDNIKFGGVVDEDGNPLPDVQGVLVVECGTHEFDSTFLASQSVYEPALNEQIFSRWATGNYYNAKFWSFPIDVFWGVPGDKFRWTLSHSSRVPEVRRDDDFEFDSDVREAKRAGQAPTVAPSDLWQYRRADGMCAEIHKGSSETVRLPVQVYKASYPHCVVPFDVEVHIRDYPLDLARKLAFPTRRKGSIFVDFNEEIFHHPDMEAHHASVFSRFGLNDEIFRLNAWVRIIPQNFGETPGGVWMGDGRAALRVYVSEGNSISLPWDEVAKAFKAAMPPALVQFIKSLDAASTPNDQLRSKKYRGYWNKVVKSFGYKAPQKKKLVPDLNGKKKLKVKVKSDGVRGEADGVRGPIVNHGESHSATNSGTTRRPPQKKPSVTEAPASPKDQGKKDPEPPKIEWYSDGALASDKDIKGWADEYRNWAVQWDPPDSVHVSGRVMFNWEHWFLQEWYNEKAGPGGTHEHAPNEVLDKMRFLIEMSVATKIGHRWVSEKKNSAKLKISDQELEQMFSPASLSGYIMGRWDFDGRLNQMLGGTIASGEEEGAA